MNINNPNYAGLDRNIVSDCCEKPIVTKMKWEYPLGGQMGRGYKVHVCEKCGEKCNEIDVCAGCGLRECEGCTV